MNLLIRWIASLTLTPLAVLTLQGLAVEALALTDSNAEVKEAAADRAGEALAAAAPPRAAPAVYVPVSAKRLDRFQPVLPPERALGQAMAQAHALALLRRSGAVAEGKSREPEAPALRPG